MGRLTSAGWRRHSKRERRFRFGPRKTGSERRRCVDPDYDDFLFARVVPSMAAIAFEPKALVLMEDITFRLVEPDFKFTFQHVHPVFTLVSIGTVAAGCRRNSH